MKETCIVVAHGLLRTPYAKTTHGMVRGPSRYRILGIVDPSCSGQDAGELLDGRRRDIPIFDSVAQCLKRVGGKPDYDEPAGGFVLPIILVVAFVYFFMIRPQQKRTKEHKAMLDTLSKGDKVVTTGGIHGSVVGVKDDRVVLRIDENCKIEVVLQNVAAKLDK